MAERLWGRRSIRLPGYDYALPGTYFVTICTKNRACVLGEVVDGHSVGNEYGEIAGESWLWLAKQYDFVELDEFVVMPNHLHCILHIRDQGRGGSRAAPTTHPRAPKSLGELIGAFKTVSTKSQSC